VDCFYYNKFESTDESIADCIEFLKDKGKVQTDDVVINTASMPINGRGRTNMIKITHVR
jgi:pyruvate kinase